MNIPGSIAGVAIGLVIIAVWDKYMDGSCCHRSRYIKGLSAKQRQLVDDAITELELDLLVVDDSDEAYVRTALRNLRAGKYTLMRHGISVQQSNDADDTICFRY